VGTFLIGCAFLLVVGCSGTSSESSNKKEEQGSSPKVTASKEEARCEGTRTTVRPGFLSSPHRRREDYLTNDLPGCPKGGPLSGTDKTDKLNGGEGDDVIRGLGGKDTIVAGPGNDKIYGGDGNDLLGAEDEQPGEDVLYGGDGNDLILSQDAQRDKIYAGKGKDKCFYDHKLDYVDSSCEKKISRVMMP